MHPRYDAVKVTSVAVLSWPLPFRSRTPTIIYRRPLKIRNVPAKPHKQSLLLIEVIVQGGDKLSIYAWDLRHDMRMYTLLPDADYQKAQASALQYMHPNERRTNIDIFLQNDLSFGKKMCEDGLERTFLTIDQGFEVEYSEDEEEEAIDYEAMAAAQLAETNAKIAARSAKVSEVKAALALTPEQAEEKKKNIEAAKVRLKEAKAASKR